MSESEGTDINKMLLDPGRKPVEIGGVRLWGKKTKLEMSQELRAQQKKGSVDSLTGVFNKDELKKRLTDLLKHNENVALMFVDADNFKQVNDVFGHQIGDQVLHILSQRMAKEIKPNDVLGRFGGEEFVIAMPGMENIETAAKRAEEISLAISRDPIHFSDEQEIAQTISVGVSLLRPGDTLDSLIERADAAMYLAKRNGKNRVMTEENLINRENNV